MSVLVHVIWPMEWKIASALARHCWIDWGRWAAPIPDPSDAAAYLADCTRRCVEPGPSPSLAWRSDRTSWKVDSALGKILVSVACGGVWADVWSDGDLHLGECHVVPPSVADILRLAEMSRVVEEAMR